MYSMRTEMELIHLDRRDDRRYPINLELRYKTLERQRARLQGSGRTVNMSSGGVLFGGDQDLPPGTFVELSIHWPVLLHNTCPLTLRIEGRVVRCDDRTIAVATTRYQFLTRGAGRVQQFISAQPGSTYIA
jgi:hypothetical protein